ncbi:HEAT repeat domain-containing protein [Nocardia sp. NPDC060256]|uniref:HEAT repeat domain-containing protein n=1 Tax=unclassified Nocardia TaxID=2637762 RepID=UPI003663938E
MDDRGIRRIAARIYEGWLWYDERLLSAYVERVANGAYVIADGTAIRWAAWLSAAPTAGVHAAQLLRWGVPASVVDIVEMLRQRPQELPIEYVERIFVRRAAAVVRFAELTELADAAPSRYQHWRAAHRLLGEKLGLPTPEAPAPAAMIAPTEPTEHWHEFAGQVAAQQDPQVLDQLIAGYQTGLPQCCHAAVCGAIYAASSAPHAAWLADKWWDSQDHWEAMVATRATTDADRLRSRLADERPGVVAAAITTLPPDIAEPAEIVTLGQIVRRAEPHWRWCRLAAARRLRAIGGSAAEEALRDRFLSPLDPPWREDPQWLATYGAALIPAFIANLDEPEWWYEAPYALGKLRATAAEPAICLRLRAHPDWTPGIDALGRIGSADAVATLTRTATAGTADTRDHSLRALTRISTEAAVQAAIDAMDDVDPTVRDRAARILVRHGDQRALAALIRLCDTRYAVAAARALGRIADPRAEPTLWQLFTTGTPRVRSAAGRALATMTGPLRFLDHAAWDADPGLRRAFIRLLGYRRDWIMPYAIERGAQDFDPKVRSATAHLIATLGIHPQHAILDRLLNDPDPRVRNAAAKAVRRLDSRKRKAAADPRRRTQLSTRFNGNYQQIGRSGRVLRTRRWSMNRSRDEMDSMVRQEFGSDIVFTFTEFPSGAMELELRWQGHFAVIQGRDNEWGLSVDIADGDSFTGHDHIFNSFDDALQSTKPLMLNPRAPQNAHSTEGWLRNRLTDITDD